MTADFDTIRAALSVAEMIIGPKARARDAVSREIALAALSRVQAASEQAEQILPADEVCACLDETGGRQVRIFERCERCHALTESDLAEQLAEQADSADEWREQWERAEARIEQAEKTLEQIAEGPTWRSFTPADVARAALKLLRGKDTR